MLADFVSSTACDRCDRTRRIRLPVVLLSREFRQVRAMQVAGEERQERGSGAGR